ncbi:MAG TPA: sigma-70 family RNA polymerase sigma factor [Verrucomicrobiae bacterium]
MNSDAVSEDARLVQLGVRGDRDAFGRLVARYQSPICALAYSACGNVSQSEDLAQETFLAAWRKLSDLREPEKFKFWLFGIARNLINNTARRQTRNPLAVAAPLDEELTVPAATSNPAGQAISKEEEEILWRSLEQIPEAYREPLVLFYREHQSIEEVATTLELSEEAARQRLSRGRKLLQEQVLAFVEGALERTNPGQAFTLAVLAALPAFTISAKAGTLGAAAKGGAAIKGVGLVGWIGALLGPLLGLFATLLGAFEMWVQYRNDHKAAGSDQERNFCRGLYRRRVGSVVLIALLLSILFVCVAPIAKSNPSLLAVLVLGSPFIFASIMVPFGVWSRRAQKKLFAEISVETVPAERRNPLWEYRSRFQLFGLPFIHLRFGNRFPNYFGISRELNQPVKAWIAAGPVAFGMLFASGGVAIAPISFGGCTVGLLSFGGFSLGALAFGGFAYGIWAAGGFAAGWQAIAGCAVAWNAASGGIAVAHALALGRLAHAAQANNAFVEQLFLANPFFRIFAIPWPFFLWLSLFWGIPTLIRWTFIALKSDQKLYSAIPVILALSLAAAIDFSIFHRCGRDQPATEIKAIVANKIANPGSDASLTNMLRIKLFVDGSDVIAVSGSKLWLGHRGFKLPDHVSINGKSWDPQWRAGTNALYENLDPAFKPGGPQKFRVSKQTGRGDVAITQMPAPENNETLAVWIYDYEPGADWYDLQISW